MDHKHNHNQAGYDRPSFAEASAGRHAGHSLAGFKKKFYVSLILTLPILLLSLLIQNLLNISIKFPGDQLVLFLISSFIFFYGGGPFLKGAAGEIKNKALGMMALISLAISVAYVYSSSVVFGLKGEVFFWELATLIDIMLFGHWLEMKSVMGASTALEKLSQLIPDEAHRKYENEIVDADVSKVKKGDIILVNSNPQDIASLILFGKAVYKKMVQNLAWATGYNVIAIPLAAGALAGYGILLSPTLGAIFMSLSTIIVAINAKLLRVSK